MPEKYRTPEWIRYFAEDFKEPAGKIAAAGKRFMYHNHNFEFQKIAVPGYEKPVRIIEYLMDSFTPEEMGFTLDTYWVAAAGGGRLQLDRKTFRKDPLRASEGYGGERPLSSSWLR